MYSRELRIMKIKLKIYITLIMTASSTRVSDQIQLAVLIKFLTKIQSYSLIPVTIDLRHESKKLIHKVKLFDFDLGFQ